MDNRKCCGRGRDKGRAALSRHEPSRAAGIDILGPVGFVHTDEVGTEHEEVRKRDRKVNPENIRIGERRDVISRRICKANLPFPVSNDGVIDISLLHCVSSCQRTASYAPMLFLVALENHQAGADVSSEDTKWTRQ